MRNLVPAPNTLFVLGLTALLVPLELSSLHLLGAIDDGQPTQRREFIELTFYSLWSPVLIGCASYLQRGARADLLDLKPILRLSTSGYEEFLHRLSSPPRWACLLAPTIATALAFLTEELDTQAVSRVLEGGDIHPRDPWLLANDVLIGAVGGSAAIVAVQITRSFSKLGTRDVAVDLLNYQRLRPFGRIGLRCSLIFAAAASLLLLVFITSLPALLVNMVPVMLLASLALIWPSLGVRQRVREAKEDAWLELAKKLDASNGIADKVQLLQYRWYLESVPNWPFDTPALLRFVLYGVLPLASWVLAALVERGVDSVLR